MSSSRILKLLISTLAASALAGCATQPIGPTVQVMPTPGKPFDMFAQEEAYCKNYAKDQIAGAVDQANNKAIGTAVLAAGLGAAVGGAAAGGTGAANGAAGGAVVGTAIGANGAANDQMTIQQRYDAAYSQCMYSKGNQVPGFGMQQPVVAPPPPPPEPVAPAAPAAPRVNTLVLDIQKELIRIGLLSGKPDGSIGPKTRGAILDYQKMRGLTEDGKPSQKLLDDLKKN